MYPFMRNSLIFAILLLSTQVSRHSTATVKPVIFENPTEEFPEKVTIYLSGNNTSFLLKLQKDELASCRHYYGSVKGLEDSYVTADLCNGIHGEINTGNESYIIYKRISSPSKPPAGNLSDVTSLHIITPKHNRKRRSDKKPRYLELYVIYDHSYYLKFNKNSTLIEERNQELMQIMAEKLVQLDIQLIQIGLEIWEKEDMIKHDPKNTDNTLQNLANYKQYVADKRIRNDLIHLITWKALERGDLLGKAFDDGACSRWYGVGISRDGNVKNVGKLACTVLHEMGHNLGIKHDDLTPKCNCLDNPSGKRCIMAPSIVGLAPRFSQCSIDMFEEFMSKRNGRYGRCLYDYPTEKPIFGEKKQVEENSKCGNGQVDEDEGEECDCLSPEDCECCDLTTCKWHAEAECTEGECCEQCKLKERSTICREMNGPCDLPEYCDGTSPQCPTNVLKQDTESCQDGMGFCKEGMCMSHLTQCKMFGEEYIPLSSPCYYPLNTQGNVHGHCGKEGNKFIPCQLLQAPCGRLLCARQEHRPAPSPMWNTDPTTGHCSESELQSSMKPGQSIILALDGIRCGQKHVCMETQCIEIDMVRKHFQMPSCENSCSHNGVCNTNINCHCNPGYTGTTCEEEDEESGGGSVDSGPPPIHEIEKTTPPPATTEPPDTHNHHGNAEITIVVAMFMLIGLIVAVIGRRQYMIHKLKKEREGAKQAKQEELSSLMKDMDE